MKVDPDGVLASLIKSPILVNPYSAIENQLVKKAAYVQSRVEKLQQYNDLALAGTQLTPSQDDARTKLDEVVKHQKYVKHLTAIVQRDRQLFEKSVKAADILLTYKLDSFRSTIISQANVYGEIIKRLLHPSNKAAFLSGTKGAIKITKKEVNALSRLKSAFYPTFDQCASLDELEARASDAAVVVSHIFSEAPHVVDKETGLSGKEVFALLNSIKNCDFFSEGCSSLLNGTSDIVADAPDTGSTIATSSDSVNGDNNKEISFPLVSESTHPERINGADCTEVFKNMVNTVSEEIEGKKAISSPPWKSDDKVNDENSYCVTASDSSHGTANQYTDAHSTTVKEMKKKPDYGPKMRNTTNYNGGRSGSGRYNTRNFIQPWDRRYRDRTHKEKGYGYVPENGEQQRAKKTAPILMNTESGDNQRKQRDRRFPRKQGDLPYKDGRLVSRQGPPEFKEEDNRVQYSRQNVIRTATRPSVPLNYELHGKRRPAPTSVGFIFADRR